MIVIKNPAILRSAKAMRHVANYVKKENARTRCFGLATNVITDDMPESGGGGGGGVTDGPDVAASDDDDGGDDDGEPARSRPHSKPSPKPGTASASPKHTVLDRSRTRHQAEKPPEIKIAVGEFDLAAAIGMSVDFLRKDRSGKRIIPFFRIGKAIRYNPQRVNEALASLEEGGHKPPKPKAKKSVNSLVAG